MIAKALIHEPQLLILDEPTAGVDIELRREMWSFLKEINKNGTTIILTTHYLEEAEQLCRNIGIIDKGTIVANTSMKDLLGTLNVQGFVFDLDQPLVEAPIIEGFPLKLEDPLTLVAAVNKDRSINALFSEGLMLFQQFSCGVVGGVGMSKFRHIYAAELQLSTRFLFHCQDRFIPGKGVGPGFSFSCRPSALTAP